MVVVEGVDRPQAQVEDRVQVPEEDPAQAAALAVARSKRVHFPAISSCGCQIMTADSLFPI